LAYALEQDIGNRPSTSFSPRSETHDPISEDTAERSQDTAGSPTRRRTNAVLFIHRTVRLIMSSRRGPLREVLSSLNDING